MNIIWLDDKPETVSFEKELIEENNEDINIELFEKIDEFLEYIEINENSIKNNTIFIIDVMLINENKITFKDININIPIELMAGVTLVEECLDKYYPQIPIVIYTSRGGEDAEVFGRLQGNERYNKNLFIVGKEDFDTTFKKVMKKLGVKTWE